MRWPSLIALALVGASATARAASPEVDEAVARYEGADFEGALEALARAEAGQGLDRAELLRLLATRALVDFALGRSEALDRDLVMLASLEPEYDLGRRAPPAVRQAFEAARGRVRGRLALRVDAAPAPGGLRVRAEVEGDAAGLVRATSISARRPGGPWRTAGGGTLDLAVTHGAVEAWAVARGPGGAPVATAGSAEAPLRLAAPAAERPRRRPSGGGNATLWIGIGVGAAVAAVATTVLVVVASGADEDTLVGPPRLERGTP